MQAAVLKALWGEGRAGQFKEIIFTLSSKGHRLDPFQACLYARLVLFRRLIRRRGDLKTLFQSVWRVEARRSRVPGPIAKLFAAVEALGWAWVEPFALRLQDGRELNILQTSCSLCDHEVHEALRRVQWRRAAARRHDMEGAEVGLDVHATHGVV